VSSRALVPLAVIFALIGVAAVLVTQLVPGGRNEPLPVIAELPDFTLTEASGRSVSRRDLAGAPWVADLIFTSCGGICPAMSKEMASLQSQTEDLPQVRLVSISVDPERDTPERLAEYARRFGADPARWFFLTGDAGTIRTLARNGLLLPVADGDPARGDEEVLHSSRFVLIDAQGRMRSSYDVRDPEAMLRLRGDLRQLVQSERGARAPRPISAKPK
jgi:cytochrome oxidase Cu insertion factor (SCO1/SenC/PrrC family)